MTPANPPEPVSVTSAITPGRWRCPVCGRPGIASVTSWEKTGGHRVEIIFACGHPATQAKIREGQK